MKHFYVYSYKTIDNSEKDITRLVIFCPYKEIKKHVKDFKQQLRNYFLNNIPPDEICIIGGKYHQSEMEEVFVNDSNINFDIIPHFNKSYYKDSIFLFVFDQKGDLKHINAQYSAKLYFSIDEMINRGMVSIFNIRGGLIVAHEAHHYVFPSGKHCDRFLRTGNVLVNGPEIYFLASQVLKKFSKKEFNNIYSDTSSINSLAFAVSDLTKRFNPNFITPHIESFGSYKKFEKEKFSNTRNSFFLISSSTSGSILDRMINHSKESILLDHIAIMYGLHVNNKYQNQVICDLTHNAKSNPEGLSKFNTANVSRGDSCKLCQEGSAEVVVKGDVFLLEKPKVNDVIITKSDPPHYLKSFIKEFKSKNKQEPSAIRCHFKECSSDKNYEIFIDFEHILNCWNKGNPTSYSSFFKKLKTYIQKSIPASTKYLVYLPDQSSKKLAKLIQQTLTEHNIIVPEKRVISMDQVNEIEDNIQGTIIIVSSCIVTGKNLLYLSRALRKTEDDMSRIYFTGIKRVANEAHQMFLKSNLGQGKYGKLTHSVINIEEIYCENASTKTPWHIEYEFAKSMQSFLEESNPEKFEEAINFFYHREVNIAKSGNNRGLAFNLFFNHPVTNEKLAIRKGFVFADDDGFEKHASQSDVYFIISTILNTLRFSTNGKKRLIQTEYVRNLISPENFTRFNDGILQAAFLRASKREELLYNLTQEDSNTMQIILTDMIRNIDDEHAEGLTEFFYAIAIKKLKLMPKVIDSCIKLFYKELKNKNINAPILESIIYYIENEQSK